MVTGEVGVAMSSSLSGNKDIFVQHVAQHQEAFMDRIDEIKWMLKAKNALATLERLNEITAKPLGTPIQVEEITKLAKYSKSRVGRGYKVGPLNESAVLLLSAYLEGFIERLYEECLRHLLHENFASAKVLDILANEARKQFANPSSGHTAGLFRKLTLDITASFGPAFRCPEVNELVEARNRIAHGSAEEISDDAIVNYLDCVRDFGKELSGEICKEITTLS